MPKELSKETIERIRKEADRAWPIIGDDIYQTQRTACINGMEYEALRSLNEKSEQAYYQLCPKCLGEGIVDNPFARGTASNPMRTCPVCYGAKTFYHSSYVDEIEKLKEENRKHIELLCIMHRDGGHYISDHGIDKAIEDAKQIYYQMRQRIEFLESKTTDLF